MARYIDADALIERLKFKRDTDINKKKYSGLECAISQVQKQPTADVVEVKHGEWVYWQPDGTNHLWSCSVCGGAIITPMKFVADHIKYCEHCGAKMDGERKCDNE